MKKIITTVRPLKIVHVGNHTIPCVGGVEQVIWQSARAQAGLGHDVEILVFDTCTRGNKLPSSEKVDGITITRIPEHGFSFFRLPKKEDVLPVVCEKDIIHVHGFGGWLHILAQHKKGLAAKLVLTTHGGFFHTPRRKWLKWIYSHVMLPKLWKKIDAVIFVSATDEKAFSYLPPGVSKIIPNGIDEKMLTYPIPHKNAEQFVYVGRLSSNKRVDRLLDVLSIASKNSPSIRLEIIGEDWEGLLPSLQQRARERGVSEKVTFHGRVSDDERLRIMAESSFVVSASEYEGFGISSLEGMALGCIPCLQAIPSFELFVREGGGVITDYRDATSAAEAWVNLVLLSTDNRKKQSARVQAYGKTYGWNEIALRQIELYQKILTE